MYKMKNKNTTTAQKSNRKMVWR